MRSGGRGGVTAILFSGVIFYQHRQPSALTNPSTPSLPPGPYIARHPAYYPLAAPIPTDGSPTTSSSSSSSTSYCHPGHPTAATRSPYYRPISPPYRCSITFAMHFFPSSFFIKLDYNCIASSSCGIAGRKNGTLPGMRVHPRSTGRARGSERKAGEGAAGRTIGFGGGRRRG